MRSADDLRRQADSIDPTASSFVGSRWAAPGRGTSACITREVLRDRSRCRVHHHARLHREPAEELPDYQEKCLRIYDAVDYAENAFDVPVVAYSGEKDAQKKAADNIENALKDSRNRCGSRTSSRRDWNTRCRRSGRTKAEAEYRKYADKGREPEPGTHSIRDLYAEVYWDATGS